MRMRFVGLWDGVWCVGVFDIFVCWMILGVGLLCLVFVFLDEFC